MAFTVAVMNESQSTCNNYRRGHCVGGLTRFLDFRGGRRIYLIHFATSLVRHFTLQAAALVHSGCCYPPSHCRRVLGGPSARAPEPMARFAKPGPARCEPFDSCDIHPFLDYEE